MHGDWIPDNLGRLPDGLAVWDWEHSVDDAPVGLDLLRWSFQQAMAGNDLFAAVAATEAAEPGLDELGVAAAAHHLLVSLYLLDEFVRWTKMIAGGMAWNPKWYPHLLDVVRARSHPDLAPTSLAGHRAQSRRPFPMRSHVQACEPAEQVDVVGEATSATGGSAGSGGLGSRRSVAGACPARALRYAVPTSRSSSFSASSWV